MELDFNEDPSEYLAENFPAWLNSNSNTDYSFSDESRKTRKGETEVQDIEEDILKAVELTEEGVELEAYLETNETEAVPTTITVWDSPISRGAERQLSVAVAQPERYQENPRAVRDQVYESLTSDLDQLLEPDEREELELGGARITDYNWQE